MVRRHIVFLAFPDVQVLDVTGPLEVFGRAARLLVERGLRRDLAYTVEIVAATAGPIETSSGIKIVADRPFRDVRTHVDTLLVAGGRGARRAAQDRALPSLLSGAPARRWRVARRCSGPRL